MGIGMIESIANIIKEHAPPERIATRNTAEDEARSLIVANLGNLSRVQLEQLLKSVDRDNWDGQPKQGRFGITFQGANGKLICEQIDKVNEWIKTLWTVPIEKSFDLVGQFMNEKPIHGAGYGFPSIILYLRDPNVFNVWLSVMVSGIECVKGVSFTGSTSKSYKDYNTAVNEFRDENKLEPQTLDIVLTRIKQINSKRARIESILNGGAPPWPTEDNWQDIVDTHNEMVDAGKFNAVDVSSASWSITLVMICAVMGKTIPTKYRLKTRPMGIDDHPQYVKDYAESVCGNITPGKGKVIRKPLELFAGELGVSVLSVCENLLAALKSGQINKTPSSVLSSPDSSISTAKVQELAMKDQAAVPSNIILYGPPGTGKTYSTKHMAVELCDGVTPKDRKEVLTRYEQLRDMNRIEFVTFHQSFSYEDFIEGLRPELAQDGVAPKTISYECHPGVFRRICSAAEMSTEAVNSSNSGLDVKNRRLFKMSLGDTSLSSEDYLFKECIENKYILLGYGQGLDYTGLNSVAEITDKLRTEMPDIQTNDYNITSVNYILNEIKQGDLILVSYGNLQFRAIGEITGNYEWIDRKGVDTYCQKRSVRWLRVFEDSQPIDLIFKKRMSQMTLYLMDQSSIKREALQALLNPSKSGKPDSYVLVIDEINRANISKVFGELITLIEPDKRLNGKEPIAVRLPYSDKPFGVPSNLHIIGTMNTADRSIALVDIALRRRFEFKEMMPEYDLLPEMIDGVNVQALLQTINQRIEYLYDRDHVIGHAYLMNVPSLDDLRRAFINKIIPLLQEYFYGDWKKICLVLGCPVDESGKQNNGDSAIIKADNNGLGYAWQEYEDRPTFRIHQDFEDPQYTDLKKFFDTVFKGPGKSE